MRPLRWHGGLSYLRAIAALILVMVLSFAVIPPETLMKAQSLAFDTSKEYVDGYVQIFSYLSAYYAWINVNGTHTIFLALNSNQLPSPVSAFVGQGYNSSTGAKVFIGNVLLSIEVYNDTNGNGYLDANYAVGQTELKYTILMNASRTFTTIPLEKTTANGVPHYTWGVSYGYVQANLVDPSGVDGSVANITYVTMLYDYSIRGNTTYLKTSYEIGNVTLVPPVSPGVTLDGLSLSLLHATLTLSSGQLSVSAGSSTYNSQMNASSSLVDAATVKVDNASAYDFQFRDNYTLLSNPSRSFPALYTAAPIISVPITLLQGQESIPLIRVQDYVRNSLPSIVDIPPTLRLNYNASTFLYRISYPTWGGVGLQHDPTYIAHLGLVPNVPPSIPPGLALFWLIIVPAVTAAFLMVLGVYWIRKRRKPTVRDSYKFSFQS